MSSEDILSVKLEVLHSDVVEVKTALNKLSEAITKLALVEQQQAQTATALERAFKAITRIEERLSAIELSQPKSRETSAWVDRAIFAIVAAAGGYLLSRFRVGL